MGILQPEAAESSDRVAEAETQAIFFGVSACFASLFFGYSFFARFTVLIYQRYNLSTEEIGFIGLLGILSGIPSTAFWGWVADRTGKRRLVLASCISICTVCQSCLSLAPLVESHSLRVAYCSAVCIAYTMTRGNDYGQLRGVAMRALARCGRPDAYGKLRLWGAVTWGLAHPLLGWFLDFMNGEIWWLFIGNALVAIMTVSCILGLLKAEWTDEYRESPAVSGNAQRTGSQGETVPSEAKQVSFRDLLRIICTRPAMVSWLLCSAAQAMGMQHVFLFLFLFMDQRFHASGVVMGLSVFITVVFEVPIFAMGEVLVPRLGPSILIIIAMVSFIVRVFGYTVVPNEYAILALEPLHGVTYSCFTLATVHYLNDHVPMHMISSAQGLMSSVNSVGSAIGAILGGWEMDLQNGGILMFRCDAVVMSSVLAVFILTQFKGWGVTSHRGPLLEGEVALQPRPSH